MDESNLVSLASSMIIALLAVSLLALAIYGIIYQNRKVKENDDG